MMQGASLTSRWALLPAAAALLWPAAWNGYPIVFADSGTYLSQAVHHYAGWDRPVFYSLFILPLHATLSLWPVAVAQALLTAWMLRLACRTVAPRLPATAFVALVAAMSALTWLPWLASKVMPDILTPLTVLGTTLLGVVTGPARLALTVLTACMITTQQSSVALAFAIAALVPLCTWLTGRAGSLPSSTSGGAAAMLLPFLPPALAVLALCSANMLAHGRFAPSPYGSVFLLARVIYDGPGADALRRDCPAAGWRLCPFASDLPPTSDHFLWSAASPLNQAGGPKALAAEAGAIVRAAVTEEPLAQAAASARNTLDQLRRFASGDGLNAWPAQVTPWIERDFPRAEAARYAAARQQNGGLAVPWLLGTVHQVVGVIGIAACLALLPEALRRGSAAAPLLLAALLALPVSAAITGALSGPHDRYQARVIWLPPFAATLGLVRRRT